MSWNILRASLLAMACLAMAAPSGQSQQMEMRQSELFDAKQFAEAKPAVGETAPALTLQTLDGETVKLSDYRGKTTVLIKAGYT